MKRWLKIVVFALAMCWPLGCLAPARSPRTEGGAVRRPTWADEFRKLPTRPPGSLNPIALEHGLLYARAVPLSACDAVRVEVPREWETSGQMTWLLCYALPTQNDSGHPLSRSRPDRVVFTGQPDLRDVATDLVSIAIPPGSGPYAVAALVSLPEPPDGFALFNARNEYGEARLWATQPDDRRRTVETHGTFHASHILPDGVRVEVPVRPVANGCIDELSPEFGLKNGASFHPEGEVCPDMYYYCAPGRFHCDYEP